MVLSDNMPKLTMDKIIEQAKLKAKLMIEEWKDETRTVMVVPIRPEHFDTGDKKWKVD